MVEQAEDPSGGGSPSGLAGTYIPLVPIFFAMLLMAILTVIAIASTVQHQQEVELARLQAIASLKATQITQWLNTRVDDARALKRSKDFLDEYYTWRAKGDAASLEKVRNRLTTFSALDRYTGVVLLDDQGHIVWHTPEFKLQLDEAQRGHIFKLIENGQPSHLGPFVDAKGKVHFAVVVPVEATPGRPALVIVLATDSASFPPTELLSWPIPTTSGEAVLFRRDGEDVLYLSELRFRQDTAVRLRHSVADRERLTSQLLAMSGVAGAVEGVDYRGEAALAVGKRIEGTDWYLMAKMDRSELYGLAKRDVIWIVLAGVLVFFMLVTGLFLHRQRRAIARADAVQHEQDGRLRSLALFSSVADSSSDAIFAKDLEGRYLLFNHAAERVTGTPAKEVIGRTDTSVFPPEQASIVMANDQQVMRERRVFTYDEVVDTPNGSYVFLAVKGPLYGDKGKVIGIYGISRDITERKSFEETLRRNNDELRRFNFAMVGRELDMIRLKREVNALAAELGRPSPYSLASIDAETRS